MSPDGDAGGWSFQAAVTPTTVTRVAVGGEKKRWNRPVSGGFQAEVVRAEMALASSGKAWPIFNRPTILKTPMVSSFSPT